MDNTPDLDDKLPQPIETTKKKKELKRSEAMHLARLWSSRGLKVKKIVQKLKDGYNFIAPEPSVYRWVKMSKVEFKATEAIKKNKLILDAEKAGSVDFSALQETKIKAKEVAKKYKERGENIDLDTTFLNQLVENRLVDYENTRELNILASKALKLVLSKENINGGSRSLTTEFDPAKVRVLLKLYKDTSEIIRDEETLVRSYCVSLLSKSGGEGGEGGKKGFSLTASKIEYTFVTEPVPPKDSKDINITPVNDQSGLVAELTELTELAESINEA